MKERFARVYATAKAKEHMEQKHQVRWEEVLEALGSNPPIYRTYPSPTGERRYVAFGQTETGRKLVIVMAQESPNIFRVITAYEPKTKKQLRRFKRKGGK
ncbi:MAG: BrnT family toxin [Armatimonadetes bacterium]|nr:BrnT family toxin [Armatimonadota bacterium]